MKTTKLLYPEWQGYGEDRRVYDGAYTVLEAFSGGAPFFEVDVPANENLIVEGGILGRSAIVRGATIASDHLAQAQPDRIFMIGGTCGSEIAPVSYLNQHYHGNRNTCPA
jgi:arginase